MKTLVEMLHDEMVRSGYFGANGRDDEMLAGIVGAVQEWLSQDEMVASVRASVDDWARLVETARNERALRVEAGKGLGDDVPAP